MHGAIAENRSVLEVHEDSPKVGATKRRRNRGKSAFLEVPLNLRSVITLQLGCQNRKIV